MRTAVVVVLALVASSPAFAQKRDADANARFGALRQSGAGPYASLFQPRPPAAPTPAAPVKPKVVCGMTVMPADPSLDPKMLVPRKDDGVDYRRRVIEPPICNPAR